MHNSAANISPQKRTTQPELRVLIAAGGTGGHVYPAIAIADALKALHANVTIQFVGTKTHMEWQAVPKAGYDIVSIWISGLHRRITLKNLLFPVKLLVSLWQSLRIIASFKPDSMICCGGYAAGPIGWVAAKKQVSLFIQEQNSFPGITNRLLAPKAKVIFTAFKDSDEYLPGGKTILAGNPTRNALVGVNKEEACSHFKFSKEKLTLLILGGSGGARTLNEAMLKNIEQFHDQYQLQIIWQCGKRYHSALKEQLADHPFDRLRLVAFLQAMPEAYAVADLAVSRSGALSCSELALTGTPSILVPSPNVAGDHQTKNARSMVENGASALLPDKEAVHKLPTLVNELITDQQKLETMQKAALKMARPDAAKEIAREIIQQTIQSNN